MQGEKVLAEKMGIEEGMPTWIYVELYQQFKPKLMTLVRTQPKQYNHRSG